MKTRLLLLLPAYLLSLTASCDTDGGGCDTEGHITSASALRSRMKCTESQEVIPIFDEGKESFEILEFPNLVNINGALDISGFPNVREIRFPKLESVNSLNGDSRLTVHDMPSLELVDFGALKDVVDYDNTPVAVSFYTNPRLQTINIDALETAASVEISGLDSLVDFSLPAITNDVLGIGVAVGASSNLRLESIDLGTVSAISALTIVGNPTLMRVRGSVPSEMSGLVLTGLPFLSEFDLPVTSVDGALTVQRVGLTTLELNEIVDAPLIEIRDNTALTSISMAALERSSSYLHIQDNEVLSSIRFPSLDDADVLRILENPMLPDCQVMEIAERVEAATGSLPSLEVRFNLEDECSL